MPDTPPAAPHPPPGRSTSAPTLAPLADHADELRQTALDAGLAHAHVRNQLAAALLRTRWPTAAAVDAGLSSKGNAEIWAVLDSDGHRLWSREAADEVIQEAESALSHALDFADHALVGWVRMEMLGLGIHRLSLPSGSSQGGPEGTGQRAPWKDPRRRDSG